MSEHPPEFELIPLSSGRVGALVLTHSRACTSLSDEDATERMNRVNPTGISSDWTLYTEGVHAPVACQDRPETHRHLVFRC